MKRHALTRALCLALMLMLLPQIGLMEAKGTPNLLFGTELLDDHQNVISAAVVNDTAWLLTSKALYRYAKGNDAASLVASYGAIQVSELAKQNPAPRVDMLLHDQDGLLGLQARVGTLYRILPEENGVRYELYKELDWRVFTGPDIPPETMETPRYALLNGNLLFCTLMGYGGPERPMLYSFDLASGETKSYKTRNLSALVPYKDGQLLGLFRDESDFDPVTSKMKPGQLAAFDPAADSMTLLPHQLPPGVQGDSSRMLLYYDQEKDRIYAATDTQLVLLNQEGAPQPCANLPMAGNWPETSSPALARLDDKLLVAQGSNAALRGDDPGAYRPNVQLVHFGSFDSSVLSKALYALEGVDVSLYERKWLEDNQLGQLLMNREMRADTLRVDPINLDLQRAMEKGYFLDLSDDPELMAYARRVWPQLQKLMFSGDKLYLLPVNAFGIRNFANTKAFAAVGRPIPGTMAELLDLFDWWLGGGMEQHPGLNLLTMAEVKNWLRYQALRTYMNGMIGAGEVLQFDLERFAAVVNRIDQMDTTPIEIDPSEDPFTNGSDNGPDLTGQALIYTDSVVSVSYMMPHTEPMLLAFDKGMQGYTLVDMEMMGINVTTQHPKEAKRFLKAYLQAMQPEQLASVMADWDQYIESRHFKTENEHWLRQLQLMEDYLKTLPEGAERREKELELKGHRESYEEYVLTQRYLIGPETLKNYRSSMRLSYVNDSLARVQNRSFLEKDGETLFQAYSQGAIPLAQFVEQANARLKLMALETN